ncbi:hypothetical protein PTTG_08628 [Puccinia triticina 1-1 BBBD Race 1]|uniref:Histone-lysine N-methyltransferase, H3 lysine-36 specific n=2 Tax=Puccinia triticina TaxID=208348 RepID=A0A180G4Y8_PUCT1|nr:uncharacterized protein PtA15_13A377 [Puccinia triticina]OAV87654.1 hypothetical protein PTTG_08628 [Puccinia triticina 1-1 BBBD Race 1]WAQ90977.1 hypothetical protein PtA15_13A377 [Puccinia triticina]
MAIDETQAARKSYEEPPSRMMMEDEHKPGSITILSQSQTPESQHSSSASITPVTPADPPTGLPPPAIKGTTTAPKPRRSKGKEKRAVPDDVQLITELPQANAEALKTFTQIHQNWYQNKSLGTTKQLEDAMICDCSWSAGDDPSWACSEHSGCINYLTQIECLQEQCRCRDKCQNQRFQKRLYAPIEIVQTAKKGFGMRLQLDVPKDTFVYEYLGEVIGVKALHKRLKDYAEEGIKHFYFMELQKDQYIDATKKGGFGRFLNHSCNPNCYIGKWVVGRQLRMGIFTKRDVKGGEELTFNYNVDRYGHEAQECFCGESNCVGVLGGKTQTDLGAMDELYIDALGIVDDVENLNLKGSKTKKSKRMDIDYMPVMKPIPLTDVPKVASAIRQSTSNKKILSKLLRRIMITTDQSVQKQLMRLHGFSLMSMILNEYLSDQEIVQTILEILLKWPLITKNKIVSTNIEETVMKLSDSPSEVIQTLAAEVIKMWVALEVSYRIPRDKKNLDIADGSKRKAEALLDQIFSKRLRDSSARKEISGLKLVSEKAFIRPEAAKRVDPQTIKPENLALPPDWAFERTAEGTPYYYHVILRQTQWTVPTATDVSRMERQLAEQVARQKAAAANVEDIVAKAKAEAEEIRKANEAQRLLEEAEHKRLQSLHSDRKDRHRSNRPSSSSHHHHHHRKKTSKDLPSGSAGKPSSSEKKAEIIDPSMRNAIKDKKMLRLFSNVVVHTMSRYKDSLDHEQFKRRAKELTNILCEKERKSSHYESETYEEMSSGKEVKIRAFTKDWMGKLLTRKGITIPAPSSTFPTTTTTPSSSGNKLIEHQQPGPSGPTSPLPNISPFFA